MEVECKHGCGDKFQRRHVISHQNKQCRKRPYSYCHDCDSTFEDVTVTHYPECKKYPVSCPNGCQDNLFERQEMELHLKEKCPLARVNCPLHYAGCEVRLPRKDMSEHMRDTVTYLTLLANVAQTLLKENQELRQNMEDLDKENQELKQHNQQLEVKHQELEKATQKEVEALKKEVCELKLTLGRFPIDFHVNYTINNDKYMPSFVTHSHGYQMCIRVDTNGNGDGEGTHVSIFTFLMQGRHDDHLKWPFRGEITIQIVNQAGDHGHVEETSCFDDSIADIYAGRVIGKERVVSQGHTYFSSAPPPFPLPVPPTRTRKIRMARETKERAEKGWGVPKFLAHTDLKYNAVKKTQYLKDDVIIVRVVRVKTTK